MYAVTQSAAIQGVDAFPIDVEVHCEFGKPYFNIVGLPDNVIKESKERISSAIQSTTGEPLLRRIIVNLAPAELRKQGSLFDLPIALSIFATLGTFSLEERRDSLFVGELSLAGELKPCFGILSIAQMAFRRGFKKLFVPAVNAPEASLINGLEVYKVESLHQILTSFKLGQALEKEPPRDISQLDHQPCVSDISEVKGQATAKRALEISATGRHNVLFSGPPGSGKSMLVKRFPGILPPMNEEELLEVHKIYSVANLGAKNSNPVSNRPFRSPHHSISSAGLIGGGGIPRPGEVTLSHHGVLFLDELPEFNRNTLELLRQPLEDKEVTISRAQSSVRFPTNFILVAAMNPCPCGYFGDTRKSCSCSPQTIKKYRSRISGPLLDRIDLQVEMPNLPYREMKNASGAETSGTVRKRVLAARGVQIRRFGQDRYNGDMTHREIRKFCALDEASSRFLESAMDKKGFSNRAHDRILKISRTIADLEASPRILVQHLAEAVNYRFLDSGDPAS